MTVMNPATSATSEKTADAPVVPEAFEDAWQAVRGSHQILTDLLGKELSEAGLPELAWYDVLVGLEISPHPLRPRDLLCRVGVTKSGLTRLIDRIESAGLVERTSCPSDRRGTFIVMTDEGRQTLAAMRPVRNRVFAEHLADVLTEAEADTVSELLGRVGASVRFEIEGDGGCDV
jgi:DNA-binding MarR family transcriptional regulator